MLVEILAVIKRVLGAEHFLAAMAENSLAEVRRDLGHTTFTREKTQ
jgi:hypothetical protein